MSDPMDKAQRLARISELKQFQRQADSIRKELGISGQGENIWQADLGDGQLVVTADGLGGGLLELVEGNFPVDYTLCESRSFGDEDDAKAAASRLLDAYNEDWDDEQLAARDGGRDWQDILDEVFSPDVTDAKDAPAAKDATEKATT